MGKTNISGRKVSAPTSRAKQTLPTPKQTGLGEISFSWRQPFPYYLWRQENPQVKHDSQHHQWPRAPLPWLQTHIELESFVVVMHWRRWLRDPAGPGVPDQVGGSPGFLLSSWCIWAPAHCPQAACMFGIHISFCSLYSSRLHQKAEYFQRNSLRQSKTSGSPLQSLPCHPHMGWTPHCTVKNLNLFLTTKEKHFQQNET